jgi:cytosine/adenosine deaminase-related metal-dependent hydrolase
MKPCALLHLIVQMHVHVAQLLPSLTAALIKGRQALGPQLENGTRFDVNCIKGQNNCT